MGHASELYMSGTLNYSNSKLAQKMATNVQYIGREVLVTLVQ